MEGKQFVVMSGKKVVYISDIFTTEEGRNIEFQKTIRLDLFSVPVRAYKHRTPKSVIFPADRSFSGNGIRGRTGNGLFRGIETTSSL